MSARPAPARSDGCPALAGAAEASTAIAASATATTLPPVIERTLWLGRLAQLVRRREEVAVGEARCDQRRQRDGAEQRPEQDQLEAHGVDRVGAGEEHAGHRPR